MASKLKDARKKDGRERRQDRRSERHDQPTTPWEPIPLHIPVPDRRPRPSLPQGDEPGRGVVVIDFGG